MTAALPPQFVPGVTYGMPEATYRAIPALGSSDVKALLRSPAHYRAGLEDEPESTEAQVLGTAIHLAVLEPERFEREVVTAPTVDRRTKDGKAAAAAFEQAHAGMLILPADAFDTVRRVADAVRAHPAAGYLLSEGVAEVSLQWSDPETGAPAKCRIDWMRPDGLLVDLKSARDASPRGFARACGEYGLHVQAAHYVRGYRQVMRSEPAGWVLVAVEKERPFAVGVYALGSMSIDAADARVSEAMRRWRDCTASGDWPAYSSMIEPIEVPPWAM